MFMLLLLLRFYVDSFVEFVKRGVRTRASDVRRCSIIITTVPEFTPFKVFQI